MARIKRIYDQSYATYGSPRITAVLRAEGVRISRNRVARLMRKANLRARGRRRFRVTTNSGHSHPVSVNRLKQDFQARCFGDVWVSDITYVRTQEGWMYLTIVLDLYNREIVGWSFSEGLKAEETVLPALQQALGRFGSKAGRIFHSDRGVQYACEALRRYLGKHRFLQSMSATGNCYDNAVAESFFSTLKKEWVFHQSYASRKEARQSIFYYIEVFYNRLRKHSALGYKSPVAFRTSRMAA